MPEYPEIIRHRVNIGPFAATVEAPLNPYGEGKDPEGGRDLSQWDAEALISEYWGREPLPVTNENYLARARIAYLRGQELPKE